MHGVPDAARLRDAGREPGRLVHPERRQLRRGAGGDAAGEAVGVQEHQRGAGAARGGGAEGGVAGAGGDGGGYGGGVAGAGFRAAPEGVDEGGKGEDPVGAELRGRADGGGDGEEGVECRWSSGDVWGHVEAAGGAAVRVVDFSESRLRWVLG